MIPNPIHRVLSVMRTSGVQHLLMGGQACILYGAAEFSRDADFAIVGDADNLERLRSALDEVRAEVTAVPPFEGRYLARGHAIHFRCTRPDVNGVRVDVMARMRGVAAFPVLWKRRTTLRIGGEDPLDVDLLSLPDLVTAKKTQRDKDWPMIRRLVEANYFEFRDEPTLERIRFWLRELRTPELLVEVTAMHRAEAETEASRAAVACILGDDLDAVPAALAAEEARERELDRTYWAPLRSELEKLRRARRRSE